MKNLKKPILIILIGLLLIWFGYMLGGRMRYFFPSRFLRNKQIEKPGKNIFGSQTYEDVFDDDINNDDGGYSDMDYAAGNFFEGKTEQLQDVNSLLITARISEIKVDMNSASGCAEYSIKNIKDENFVIKVVDSKLIVEDKTKEKFWNPVWFGNYKPTPQIILHLPKNIHFKEVIIDAGVSETHLTDLQTEHFTLSCGVGEVNIDGLTAKKSCMLNAGVGALTLRDVDITNMTVKSGVGEVDVAGKIFGMNVIEGGIGEFSLSIDGSEEDYGFDISSGLGEVCINNRSSSSFFGKHKEKLTKTNNFITIKGGLGSINLKFKE